LAKELDPRFVMFTKAVPLPNTPLMYQSVEAGFIKADYWSRFTKGEKVEPIQPLVPNADQWVARAYRQFYIRPWYMVRQLFRIRSMNDLVKNVSGFIGILGFKMSEEERPLFFRYFGLNRLRNLTKLIFGRSNIKSIE